MRHSSRQALVTSSIWDRLLDSNPRDEKDDDGITYMDLRSFKQAVARDLDVLLNSRSVDLDEEIEALPHVRNSVLNFGIIDLSSLSLLDPDDRALLRDKIRLTIERHEPRLTRVRVTLDIPDNMQRMLRFRVDAVLKVHPNKPPVTFDAMLQLSSNVYQFEGQ